MLINGLPVLKWPILVDLDFFQKSFVTLSTGLPHYLSLSLSLSLSLPLSMSFYTSSISLRKIHISYLFECVSYDIWDQ